MIAWWWHSQSGYRSVFTCTDRGLDAEALLTPTLLVFCETFRIATNSKHCNNYEVSTESLPARRL